MTYTRQQLVTLALKEWGVPGAGQTASAEDTAEVDEKLNAVMGDLAQRGIYTWGDPDTVEDAAVLHLAVLLANASARSFGGMPDEKTRITAESRLRQLSSNVLSGQPVRAEYY